MTTDNNPTTICRHVSYHKKEDTVMLSKTWQKIMFRHWLALNTPPKWHIRHPNDNINSPKIYKE
jgi:hypothetical protein